MQALIELDRVGVTLRQDGGSDERVLVDLSAAVGAGESVVILGSSGAGKSTLLKVIAGQQPVSRGQVVYRFDARQPGQFGYVSQSNSLLPWLSVYENVRFPMRILRRDAGADARIKSLLREFGLEGHERKLPRELSGGMARRTVLARALVYEPRVLLLDEPFGGLDPVTRYRLVDLLAQMRRRHGFTLVCVEHDIGAAVRLAERFWVLNGRGAALERLEPGEGETLSAGRTADRLRAMLGIEASPENDAPA